MPLSLTTVADGTPINWTTLRGLTLDIETYVNEGIPVGDLQSATPWVRSVQVFPPQFHPGPAPFVRLTSGELHYRYRSPAARERSIHHSEVNTPGASAGAHGAYVPVEGMQVSYSTPDVISSGASPDHRIIVHACWFVHEIGGAGTVNESTDHVADFALFNGGTALPTTARDVYTASSGSVPRVEPVACKQYTVLYPMSVTTAGTHDLGVRIRMYAHTGTAWRHLFIWGRTTAAHWRIR